MSAHGVSHGPAELLIDDERQVIQEDGELALARVLSSFGLIIYPYTYQGTARILIRQMRQVAESEDREANARHHNPLPGM